MKKFILIAMGILLPMGNIFAIEEKSNFIAPSQLPHTTRQMNTAGFWIARHSNPDQLILSAQEIQAFNERVQKELGLRQDIFVLTDHFKTEGLADQFIQIIKDYKAKGYSTAQGTDDVDPVLDKAQRNMNISGLVLGVEPRYGLVVQYANQRFLPTDEGLYEASGDFDFDQLQNSSLDVGTPVAIVHTSADKKWVYVFSALSQGWVQAKDIAIGDKEQVKAYVVESDIAVVIKPKADIFLDQAMSQYVDFARMGTALPFVKTEKDKFVVRVPVLNKDHKLAIVDGYMNAADLHHGFLPYTARNVYAQAFGMLNQPYGWGGVRGEQDCSAFLDEVFATMGIFLPRDSKNQALIGQALIELEAKMTKEQRLAAFDQARGAQTILPMKGHIMLYLGEVDKIPYAIHAVWAYRERQGDKDIPRVINRVVVSDLLLGEGSKKGSLLKRLTRIVTVK